jgi:hypothetical protein
VPEFNMPPGVSTNDIPGNRPEDVAEEAFWSELDEKFQKAYPNEWEKIAYLFDTPAFREYDALIHYIELARDIGYERGREEARDEAGLEQHYKEVTEDD